MLFGAHKYAVISMHHLLDIVLKLVYSVYPRGRQPIQDQMSVLGADILNNPQNNYYGRWSNYPQHNQLSPKHQSGKFRCSWEIKLCNSIILIVQVCKQWPMKRHVSR